MGSKPLFESVDFAAQISFYFETGSAPQAVFPTRDPIFFRKNEHNFLNNLFLMIEPTYFQFIYFFNTFKACVGMQHTHPKISPESGMVLVE